MTPFARNRRVRPTETVGELRSVLLAGGGTAGHVSPLLATADALRRRCPDLTVTALGTQAGLEARIVPGRGYDLRFVPRVPLPRKPDATLVRFPGALRSAVEAAGQAIDDTGAQVVVGFGGYVSSPAYLAARRRGIPIVVHEQNARPGFANRLGARLTPYVATTFAATQLPHATCVGMPLRPEIATLDRAALRAEARTQLGLDPDRTTLLVTGGSLGAARLNETMAARSREVTDAGIQVFHAAGTGKGFVPDRSPSAAPYIVREYVDRMDLAYAAADLVLCRSGASTVCELTAVGLPAVYVPLPIGNGEQRLNALGVVQAGGGVLIDNSQLTGAWLVDEVRSLILDPDRLVVMGEAAARVGVRDSSQRLAVEVLRIAHRHRSSTEGETP